MDGLVDRLLLAVGLGPGVAGVTTHEFAADLGVEPLPETGKVGGGLNGALVGGEQVEDYRDAVRAEAGGLVHAEEVLEAGGDPGGLAALVVNLDLAAGFEAQRSGGVLAEAVSIDGFEPGEEVAA